jgi:hypothetical protein
MSSVAADVAAWNTANTAVKAGALVLTAPLIAVLVVISLVVIIIIIVIVSIATSASGFSVNPRAQIRGNQCNNKGCSMSFRKNTLSNPNNVTMPSSDKQSQSMVNLSLHRSRGNLRKLSQQNAFSSANKATKLRFGKNTYNEITSYE